MIQNPHPEGLLPTDTLAALKAYQQADEEGIMVLVSRQALDEAIAALSSPPPVEPEQGDGR